jgi:CDP-diacylglycerol--glycerol-3-phosphate 3-phosphatidyltransferase
VISAKVGHALDPLILRVYSVFFKNSKINPNVFTICGLFLGIAVSLSVALDYFLFGAVFMFLTGFFDVMDGAVARSTNNVTAFGGFLDSVLDRYTDLLIMLGVFVHFLMHGNILYSFITFFAAIGIAIIPYARAKAEASSVQCSTGMLERPERLIILFAGFLFSFLLPYVIIVLAVLTHITVVQRILFVKKKLTANP